MSVWMQIEYFLFSKLNWYKKKYFFFNFEKSKGKLYYKSDSKDFLFAPQSFLKPDVLNQWVEQKQDSSGSKMRNHIHVELVR